MSYYSFSEILEDVKNDTGLSNISNLQSQIRQMIARAEEEINPYAGHLIRKRMIFYKDNGNFDGKNIKIPADFVSLDRNRMNKDGFSEKFLMRTASHFVILDPSTRLRVPFSYWALNSDGMGNPIIARNHKEAVVNFIIYKLYAAKTFNDQGNVSLRRELKNEWEDSCMAARGEDMFPGMEGLKEMHNFDLMDRFQRDLQFTLDYDTYTDYDYEFQEKLLTSENVVNRVVDLVRVFQLKKPGMMFNESMMKDKFLNENSWTFNKAKFIEGTRISFPYAGRYGFVIDDAVLGTIKLYDTLGNEINSTMNEYADYENKRIIFVSKDFISPSTIFFKMITDA